MHCGDSWAKAMAFDIFLSYSCSFSVTNGLCMECLSLPSIAYRWVSFYCHLFSTSSTFLATGCALLYLSGDTLCLHLLCLARAILSLHMLCLFRVWDFGHQVGSRESVRMDSICGSHQGKNGLHYQRCIAVDLIHIRGREDTRTSMARFCVRLFCYGSPGF